jgi:parallel beta-helix repeat protein
MNISITGRSATVLGLSLVAAAGLLALAFGPLSPPAGAVLPTAKPLSEVEPRVAINSTNTPGDADSTFKITASGSYYLTGNVVSVAGKRGIEVTANDVTIDLMGFEVLGGGNMQGVMNVGAVTGMVIRNGTVRGFSEGIDLSTNGATICRIEDIRAMSNAGNGIWAGAGTEISRCVTTGNAFNGIETGAGCTVVNCTSRGNQSTGIAIGGGSTAVGCSSSSNLSGIGLGTGSTAANCTAFSNSNSGINGSLGSTIEACTAYLNGGDGISASAGSSVNGCTSYQNTNDGINVSTQCTVRGNNCASNGLGAGNGAGIHATGADNRIEGNTCTSADRGIDVDVAGNFVTRNICSGNTTNWDVVTGNVCLVVSAATAGAVLGNFGGVAPGSTDPNANFTY